MLDIAKQAKPSADIARIHISIALESINIAFCTAIRLQSSVLVKKAKGDKGKLDHAARLERMAAQSENASSIGEIADIGESVDAYLIFINSLASKDYYHPNDHSSAIAFEIAINLKREVEKLKSILHIARAHPADAVKRAKAIEAFARRMV